MKRTRNDRLEIGGVCIALVIGFLACEQRKVWPSAGSGGRSSPGQVLYLTYCESCHGVAGLGNGPAAASLQQPPADLSQLWKHYGTPLDRGRLAAYIDGRSLMTFHGGREMPIWGEEFFEDSPTTTPNLEALRARLIEVLVEHLETLQTQRGT